jgi:hypothetical protein
MNGNGGKSVIYIIIYTLFLIQDRARVIGEVELGNVEPHRLLYICIA